MSRKGSMSASLVAGRGTSAAANANADEQTNDDNHLITKQVAPLKLSVLSATSTSTTGTTTTTNSVLGDIIAQQREFQLRQESRSPVCSIGPNSGSFQTASPVGSPSTFATRSNLNKSNLNANSNDIDQSTINKPPNQTTKYQAKRKFSLSQAMSNLASLASSDKQPGNSNSNNVKSNDRPPTRPARQRSSLVSAGSTVSSSQVAAASCTSINNNSNEDPLAGLQQDDSRPASSAEKKRGFVHKAIRRGSKMFDSMLLSSALRQSQQQQDDQQTARKSIDLNNNEQSLDDEQVVDQTAPSTQASQRVQFAGKQAKPRGGRTKSLFRLRGANEARKKSNGGGGPNGDEEDDQDDFDEAIKQLQELNNRDDNDDHNGDNEDDSRQYQRRRRKLRLGSIPHDLRRALSLSGAAHFQRSPRPPAGSGSARDSPELFLSKQAPEATGDNATPRMASNFSALIRKEPPVPQTHAEGPSAFVNQNQTAAPARLASAKQLTGGSGRLRRKNSLFAPLTSAAFYHAPSLIRHSHSQRAPHAATSNPNQTNQTNNLHESQALAGPNGAPSTTTTTAATAGTANSQSASFSLCQDHHGTYKLIIFGSSAVGKTSLIQRFLYGHFPGKFVFSGCLFAPAGHVDRPPTTATSATATTTTTTATITTTETTTLQ